MRFTSRTWFLLSVLLFLGAAWFWRHGEEVAGRRGTERKGMELGGTKGVGAPLGAFALLDPLVGLEGAVEKAGRAGRGSGESRFGYRLSNSGRSLSEMVREEKALLLENALIDTGSAEALEVPEHLRAGGEEAGGYVVQARGVIGREFRERLEGAGAEVVAYVPNNAYLVRVSGAGAKELRGAAEVQAVVVYEPYFKLERGLLEAAVENRAVSPGWVWLTGYPGRGEETRGEIEGLGLEVVAEERSPFGPQYLVNVEGVSVASVAQLGGVQLVERAHQRELLNAKMRVRLGVSTNETTAQNYLGLSGSNVWVNVNDTGVDGNHPGLRFRMFGPNGSVLVDTNGHGTHVIGTIAGSGASSPTNGNFRGTASRARVFVLPIESGPEVTVPTLDSYLVETAARTNVGALGRGDKPLISNNSWGYAGASEYNSSSARYDAAVRDALAERAGDQGMIYVFAAGNEGAGTTNGIGGEPESVIAPGTAKNVITVGATETLWGLTNEYVVTNLVVVSNVMTTNYVTNVPFMGLTDSAHEVASFSGRGNVGIGMEGEHGRFKPDVVAPGTFVVSARSRDWKQENDLARSSRLYPLLEDLNDGVGPYYRYDSGTCMAAAGVSGILAMMQELFENRVSVKRTNSPAMMKALLINGARSLGPLYNLEVRNSINYQGWGLVNVSNTIPPLFLNANEGTWPVRMIDQHGTNYLGTGESRAWGVNLSEAGSQFPLRVTLVWTDPPGNPRAGIKLVNDLDLVVSNTVTREVYYGNNMEGGTDFTGASVWEEGEESGRDRVNNVENVFIRNPAESNFVVRVEAKRVNVNAVGDGNARTGRGNDVLQDFALVISSANTGLTNALAVAGQSAGGVARAEVVRLDNGQTRMHERVGANSSLVGTNGTVSQWNFYVFENRMSSNGVPSMTNGTNVAFVTFLPPNVSRSRNVDADIDLYVSQDGRLTNLEPSVVAGAVASRARGGTEFVVFTNATPRDVYYIGVKAEDQQGGEFGIMAISTDLPFGQDDGRRNVVQGFPIRTVIPDGTPNHPGGTMIVGLALRPMLVQRVTVTNTIAHENLGDLLGNLSHQERYVVLNNHTLNFGDYQGTNTFIYDESGLGDLPVAQGPDVYVRRPDGPGSLNDFIGEEGHGVWLLSMVDNAPVHTGQVVNLQIGLDRLLGGSLNAFGEEGVDGTVAAGEWIYYLLDVPGTATNVTLRLSELSGGLEVYLKRGTLPRTNSFDTMGIVVPPGGDVSLGVADVPVGLTSGRYYVGLRNPGLVAVSYHLAAFLALDLSIEASLTLRMTNQVILTDQGRSQSRIEMKRDREVEEVRVGVRIDHPRVSDLVLHLVSPQGTRVLLAENRGGLSGQGYGAGTMTNVAWANFTERTNLAEGLIKFAAPPFAGTTSPVLVYTNSFEGETNGNYAAGSVVAGWEVTTNQVSIIGLPGLAHTGTNLLSLSDGEVRGLLPTVAGREYNLKFAYRTNSPGLFNTGVLDNRTLAPDRSRDQHYFLWSSTDRQRPGPAPAYVEWSNNWYMTSAWHTLARDAKWIAFEVTNNTSDENIYTFRTFFELGGGGMPRGGGRLTGNWSVDNIGRDIVLNGQSTGQATDLWGFINLYPFTILGGFIPGLNTLDFVTTNWGGPTGLLVEFSNRGVLAGSTNSGTAFYEVGGTGRTRFTGTANWRTNTVTFVAPTNGTWVEFSAEEPGMWIDTVELYETGSRYYLPEESLEILRGERTLGTWTLEVTDSRAGPTGGNVSPVLLGWELELQYAPARPPAIPLLSGVPYSGVIRQDETNYFFIEVCSDTRRAEARLSGGYGALVLLADRSGLPTGTERDDYVPVENLGPRVTPAPVTGWATNLLRNDNPLAAPMEAGRRYYLAVHNFYFDETNTFTLQVDLDQASCQTNVLTVRLSSGVSYRTSIGSGSVVAAAQNRYVIEVPAGAEGLVVEVEPEDGDVGVLVAQGREAEFSEFDYQVDLAGISAERLAIGPQTSPVALGAGDWYVTVFNRGGDEVSYTILAEVGYAYREVSLDGEVNVSAEAVCLSWSSTVGLVYEAQGRRSGGEWEAASERIVATREKSEYCVERALGYEALRVVVFNGVATFDEVILLDPEVLGEGQIGLRWRAELGGRYVVQARESLGSGWWREVATVVADREVMRVVDNAAGAGQQFYRVVRLE